MSDRAQRPGCFVTAMIPIGLIAALLTVLARSWSSVRSARRVGPGGSIVVLFTPPRWYRCVLPGRK